MGMIADITKLDVSNKNQLSYEHKKISKWWGKTLFYFDKNSGNLKYENFSLIGLLLHKFGYKKEYTTHGLKDWIQSKNIDIKKLSHTNEVLTKPRY